MDLFGKRVKELEAENTRLRESMTGRGFVPIKEFDFAAHAESNLLARYSTGSVMACFALEGKLYSIPNNRLLTGEPTYIMAMPPLL